MKPTIYDGRNLVARLSARIKRDINRLRVEKNLQIGLGILLVTGDQVSMSDAAKLASTAEELGIKAQMERVAQRNVARKFYPTLEEYAASPFIHGIYIQLPLPAEIIPLAEVMRRLPVEKDVGGIHVFNRGLSSFPPHEAGEFVHSPEVVAVAAALKECKVDLKGGKIVIVGSQSTAGMTKILANYLYDKGSDIKLIRIENQTGFSGAAETRKIKILDSTSRKESEIINPNGEVVVTWTNQANWLTRSKLNPGSIVIDMGYKFTRGRIAGDCDFNSVSQTASIITPVPGGIRNIVRMMILDNTIRIVKRQTGYGEDQFTKPLRRRFDTVTGKNSGALRRNR